MFCVESMLPPLLYIMVMWYLIQVPGAALLLPNVKPIDPRL
jgi:hypothetical protein